MMRVILLVHTSAMSPGYGGVTWTIVSDAAQRHGAIRVLLPSACLQ